MPHTPAPPTPILALLGAALVLGGCAPAGASARAVPAADPACAVSARLADSAGLAASFDSLHALAQSARRPSSSELVLAPHDRKPQLANAPEVKRLLQTLYPPALRRAGLGGRSEVAVLIDAQGTVRRVLLVRSSGHGDLDRATLEAVRGMRFRPALQGRCPVPFFSVIPISWALEGGGPGSS